MSGNERDDERRQLFGVYTVSDVCRAVDEDQESLGRLHKARRRQRREARFWTHTPVVAFCLLD